jgi:hypothetical protein
MRQVEREYQIIKMMQKANEKMMRLAEDHKAHI